MRKMTISSKYFQKKPSKVDTIKRASRNEKKYVREENLTMKNVKLKKKLDSILNCSVLEFYCWI